MPRRANDTWLGRKVDVRRKADFNDTSNGTQKFNATSALSSLWDWAVGDSDAMDYGNSSDLSYASSWNSTNSSTSTSSPYSSPSSYSSLSSQEMSSTASTAPSYAASSSTPSYPSFWGGGGLRDDPVSSSLSTAVSSSYVSQDPSPSPNASSPLFLLLDFGGASSASSASAAAAAAASVSPAYGGSPSAASAAGTGGHAGVPATSAGSTHSPPSGAPGANGSAGGVAASSASASPGILLMLPAPWNESAGNASLPGWDSEEERNLWALLLVLFPLFTLFGNVLVILSVHRERALQTVTNYFIVSLALADLLVAVLVMPFAVYVLVNGTWGLPTFVCDFYIAMDVTCSTSSIFNLVAISIDRYIAVTQPIKYAKHKSQRRVWLTIALVWVISAAIGSPIVLGLNNTPERLPDLCLFYNSDFIIYSSLSSFYIPCIIMVFLYYNIFKALRTRARRAKAARRPNTASSTLKQGTVIENMAQTRRLAETALGGAGGPLPLPLPLPLSGAGSGGGSGPGSIAQSSAFDDDKPTNTGSGSQEEEDEEEEDDEEEEEEEEEREHSLPFDEEEDDCDGCHVIPNDKSTEFILATVTAERRRRRQRQQQQTLAAAGVMVGSAALGGANGGRRLPTPSPTGHPAPPVVTASAAAPVVACGIVVATTGVADDGVPVAGNHDSGYAASNVVDEEGGAHPASATPVAAVKAGGEAGTTTESEAEDGSGPKKSKKKRPGLLALHRRSDDDKSKSKAKKNGVLLEAKPQAAGRDAADGKGAKKGLGLAGAVLPSQGMGAAAAAASAAGVGLSAAVASKKERKSGSRFTIYKVHKASRKKREKSSAKKERKATKTLAIVLGVFLFCWVPFFTCNIMDAICTKIGSDCQPGVTAFILTTWLGYMNSFVNPVIYTIFNPEFRKAFKKLMSVGT